VITPTLGLLFASWPEFIKPGISLFNQWQSFFNFSLTSALNGCRIKQAHLAINRRQRKKNKRNVDLYSAFTATPPQGAQVWITQFYLQTVEENGELRTVICVLEARPRWYSTLLNPVLWQSWMAAYPGCTLQMKMLFRGWPIMVHDTYTRKKNTYKLHDSCLCLVSVHQIASPLIVLADI